MNTGGLMKIPLRPPEDPFICIHLPSRSGVPPLLAARTVWLKTNFKTLS